MAAECGGSRKESSRRTDRIGERVEGSGGENI